jgi:hypothetical protein
VTYLHKQSSTVNTVVGEHEREFLTKGISSAIARARLQVNTLEAIAAALRHKESTVSETREWLKSEGLYDLVARYVRAPS